MQVVLGTSFQWATSCENLLPVTSEKSQYVIFQICSHRLTGFGLSASEKMLSYQPLHVIITFHVRLIFQLSNLVTLLLTFFKYLSFFVFVGFAVYRALWITMFYSSMFLGLSLHCHILFALSLARKHSLLDI